MLPVRDQQNFRADLIRLIPQMRAFARGLCGDATEADDLAQDALVRALAAQASFTPGTNMRAWLFTIVRNGFYSARRRTWRLSQLDSETAREITVETNPDAGLELAAVRRAIQRLAPHQREALLLVVATGLSYDDAAAAAGCAAGTIKSRVSRARSRLLAMLDEPVRRRPVHARQALADVRRPQGLPG